MDACTIITGNFLASARTLVESYRKYHSGGRFFVLIIDEPDGCDLTKENFTVIQASELGIVDFPALSMLYGAYELSMALRPVFLLHLQEQYGSMKTVFLDSDLFFTGSLEQADALLDHHSILLTPSFFSPIPEDGYFPSDRDFLAAGIFNGGFFACKQCNETRRILLWLSERLRKYAFYRPEESMFGDQKWLDLLPAVTTELHILRHLGYNVSHWNLHERALTEKNGRLYANAEPLIFYHFSGFKPSTNPVLSCHQNRFSLETLPELKALVHEYNAALMRNGYDKISQRPYSFGSCAHGTCISPIIRRVYECIGGAEKFPNPWSVDSGSFYEWLIANENLFGSHTGITNLHRMIWRLSTEAQAAFPKPESRDIAGFSGWILRDRARELNLDPVFTQSLKKYVQEEKRTSEKQWKLLLRKRHTCEAYQQFTRIVKRIIGRRLYNRWKPQRNPADILRYTMHLDGQYVRTEGVNLLSSMSGKTGIAEGARGLAEALRSAGIPMRHIDSRATPGRQLRAVTRENERIYDTTLVVGGLEEIRMSQREERGRIIGYIPWELCAFPHAYRKLLETFDEVWTLSRFSAEALSGGLSIPVIRMPLAVDVQNYSNKQRADFGIPRNAYVFLFTFDFHSAMERKNPEGLIKSFVQSFAHNKNIFLVIHGVHSSDFPSDVSILKSTIDGYDNIMLHTHYVSRPDLLALLRCADCFVSLHRSEGFGLAIAESMALGIPVIATDYGGSTDFLTNETGYPVPYSLTTLNKNIGPYPAGALWAEPDTDHASELMRKIIENPEEVTAKAHTAKKLMQTEYSLQAIGQRMKERLLILRDAPTSSKRSSP